VVGAESAHGKFRLIILRIFSAARLACSPLGQMLLSSLIRKNVEGVLVALVPAFWNVSIDERAPNALLPKE
jgi:hypothetical protein